MILDIITVGILVWIVIVGVSKGASRMTIGLLMSFGSFLLASWLGKLIAGGIYSAWCAPAVDNAVEESAHSSADLAETLPWWTQRTFHLAGKEISDLKSSGMLKSGMNSSLTDTVNDIARPLMVGFFAILLTIVLFIVINFIMHKFLMKPILAAFKMPFVHAADRVAGGVIGALEALLVVCMLAFLLRLILPYIATDVSFLNEDTIYNDTFIFQVFYNGNIFSILTSWIK